MQGYVSPGSSEIEKIDDFLEKGASGIVTVLLLRHVLWSSFLPCHRLAALRTSHLLGNCLLLSIVVDYVVNLTTLLAFLSGGGMVGGPLLEVVSFPSATAGTLLLSWNQLRLWGALFHWLATGEMRPFWHFWRTVRPVGLWIVRNLLKIYAHILAVNRYPSVFFGEILIDVLHGLSTEFRLEPTLTQPSLKNWIVCICVADHRP